MDATRLFIANNGIEVWSKVDGSIAPAAVPANTPFDIVVNGAAVGPTQTGDALVATNLDDGTQVTITLAQPEPILSLAASPNGELFVRTSDAIQSVDPGATTARLVVTAPPMTTIMGVAATNDALVWVELDAMGQHLKKRTLADGTVTVLNDTASTAVEDPQRDTAIALTSTDVLLVEYANTGWFLVRRSASDGHQVAQYDYGLFPSVLRTIAVDVSNVYWSAPMSSSTGGAPMMNCSTWPALQLAALAGGPGSAVDDTFDADRLMTDDLHLYYTSAGKAGECCCGNAEPCNGANTCTLPDVPGDAPPTVKCYTR